MPIRDFRPYEDDEHMLIISILDVMRCPSEYAMREIAAWETAITSTLCRLELERRASLER